MALKITLKPKDRMILGGTVIVNGSCTSSDLIIEYKVPILRQKDILSEKNKCGEESNDCCNKNCGSKCREECP